MSLFQRLRSRWRGNSGLVSIQQLASCYKQQATVRWHERRKYRPEEVLNEVAKVLVLVIWIWIPGDIPRSHGDGWKMLNQFLKDLHIY